MHTHSLQAVLFAVPASPPAAMTSVPQLAKRALVSALLALASLLNMQVDITRTSTDSDVRKTYMVVSCLALPRLVSSHLK